MCRLAITRQSPESCVSETTARPLSVAEAKLFLPDSWLGSVLSWHRGQFRSTVLGPRDVSMKLFPSLMASFCSTRRRRRRLCRRRRQFEGISSLQSTGWPKNLQEVDACL